MIDLLKSFSKALLPTPFYSFLRVARRTTISDLRAYVTFLFQRTFPVSVLDRLKIIRQLIVISLNVPHWHTQDEMLQCIRAILASRATGEGVIVEAGCFKGGGTAKFSLATAIVGKQLVVFDSFKGLPHNTEPHSESIFGAPISFHEGVYKGALEEVKDYVSKYGRIDHCKFVKGWFDDTLPNFRDPISVIYLDVDLVSSTRACLKYLYPLLEPNGVLFSQDAHIPLVIELLDSDKFWLNEVGCRKPRIQGLREKKLVKIVKEP
jgi:O-methyltransferase